MMRFDESAEVVEIAPMSLDQILGLRMVLRKLISHRSYQLSLSLRVVFVSWQRCLRKEFLLKLNRYLKKLLPSLVKSRLSSGNNQLRRHLCLQSEREFFVIALPAQSPFP